MPTKVCLDKATVFLVVMYGCESWIIRKLSTEGWVPKNWCFWTVVLDKTLKNTMDSKEIKPVHPKGYQSWLFIGRTDAKAEAPVLWPPDVKNWLIGKDPDTGKDWRQEEKGTTEDEMVGWHRGLNGHGVEQTQGDGEGQGSLACCSPWGPKESDLTEQLSWTDEGLKPVLFKCNQSWWGGGGGGCGDEIKENVLFLLW